MGEAARELGEDKLEGVEGWGEVMDRMLEKSDFGFLKEALERASEVKNSLAHREPDRWLEYAGDLLSGKSRSWLRREKGVDFRVSARIESELTGEIEEIKARNARLCWERVSDLSELQNAMVEKLADKIENGDIDARDLKDLVWSKTTDLNSAMRLSGEATHKVEVEHKYGIEDAMALREKILSEIQEAEVVD